MVKALSPTDVNVQSVQQIVDAIGFNFGKLDNALKQNPEMRQLLGETWKYIQQLERVNYELDAIVAGAQAAMLEMAKQRDEAINLAKDRDEHFVKRKQLEGRAKRAGEEWAKRILAGQIAYDGHISKTGVLLVLDALAGNKAAIDDPRWETLYEAIEDAGNAILEQELLEAAEAAQFAEEVTEEAEEEETED